MIGAYEKCHGFFSTPVDGDSALLAAKRTLRELKSSMGAAALLYWLVGEQRDKLKTRKGCQGVLRDVALAAELHPVLVSRARLAISMKL